MRVSQLRELARLYNIQITYEDAGGKKRHASRDALLTALRLRTQGGANNFTTAGQLEEALRNRKRELWSRGVEPVTVVWGKREPVIELFLPRDDSSLVYELSLESGEVIEGHLHLADAGWQDEDFYGKTARIPHKLPHGYHTLRVHIGRSTHETFLIGAPIRAHGPREKTWGIFTPLYAAHTARTLGVGDLGDLQAYRSWVNELGGGVVATLPMLAAFQEDDPSPYSPVSRLYWNEMYLDVERLPEWEGQSVPETPDISSSIIDYKTVMRDKRALLEKMAARFKPDREFEEFARRAREYAEFRAGAIPGGAPSASHVIPGGSEGSEGSGGASHRHRAAHRPRSLAPARDDIRLDDAAFAREVHYHLYVQYRMAQQMREVAADARRGGVGLYLDFPLGVNPKGFDAWKYADYFAKGMSVGSPPDLFFTKGQNWGFPPFDPDALRAHRYAYFRDCIRHHVEHAGILRIDHVMGLHRLFWIPEGGEAKDGIYVRYAEDELYAVLLVEARRTGTMIVGEDLGTVPQYVPRMMNKHGLRRMFVVQYEVKPDGEPLVEPAAASVASVNTHDMPTFAGFWSGKDIQDRVEQDLLDEKGARGEREQRQKMRENLSRLLAARGLLQKPHGDTVATLEAVLSHLSESAAEIVLVNLEDLWLETEPQNVPGLAGRSWRRRLRLSLERARQDDHVMRLLRVVNDKRRKSDGNEK